MFLWIVFYFRASTAGLSPIHFHMLAGLSHASHLLVVTK